MSVLSMRKSFFSRKNLENDLDFSLRSFKQVEDVEKIPRNKSKPPSKNHFSRQNVVSFAALMLATVAVLSVFSPISNESDSFKSKHLVEYLSGSEKGPWKLWKIVEGAPLSVSILNPAGLTDERIKIISNAIQSKQTLSNQNLENDIRYIGWAGALEEANLHDTTYNVPTQFDIVNSVRDEGHIVITLSDLKDDDGYTGYTRSLVANNEILKSYITIYDVHNLSDAQLSTIVKHEFGHAIGLGHSSNPNNLMHDTIQSKNSFISPCNIDSLVFTYNGKSIDAC